MARFTIREIEKKDVDGVPSYIIRGRDALERPAVFNVPRKLFPQCEEILGRSPGTVINRIFDGEWRPTDIKIVKLARKLNNHRTRKKQRREGRGRVLHF